MIVRLLPTQISGMWDLIKTGVLDFGAKHFPGNWELSNNIFQRCLAGTIQAWLCSDVEGEEVTFKGFFLTSIETDNLDGSRTLALILTYAYKRPSKELLAEGKEVVNAFAKANFCKNVTIITPPGHREHLVTDVWGEGRKQTLFILPVR